MSPAVRSIEPQAAWARAYRPLGARTLLAQLVVVLGAELVLFRAYEAREAPFHWSTHFLVGLTAAALWNLAWLLVAAAPARGQLLSILVFHLYAASPDLLFDAGIPHQRWMNVFLGHVRVHYLPGEDRSWLAIGLAGCGAYAGVLAAWLRARRREAEAGMPPGIGIGGIAVLRPQADPRRTLLAARRAGADGPPQVVLLHGLGAAASEWSRVAGELARRGLRVLTPDLLGFGRSRRIGTRFALEDQVAALARSLDYHGAGRVVLVGHSLGCAVAVRLAASAPGRVERLVLVSPPGWLDTSAARERLGRRSWLARQTVRRSPAASFLCGLMCLARSMLSPLAPLLNRGVPAEVARDGLLHSWPAYRDALGSLFEANPLPAALTRPPVPTVVVLGDADETTPPSDVLDSRYDAVEIVLLQGDHLLPLNRPEELSAVIATA